MTATRTAPAAMPARLPYHFGDLNDLKNFSNPRAPRYRSEKRDRGDALFLEPHTGIYPPGEAVDAVDMANAKAADTYHYPARCVCRVLTGWKRGSMGDFDTATGSGVLVGPSHVLLSAHQVFHRGEDSLKDAWADEVVVFPGADGDREPHGHARGVWKWLDPEFAKSGGKDHDLALVALDRPIGDETGWLGVVSYPGGELHRRSAFLAGYGGKQGTDRLTVSGMSLSADPNKLSGFDHVQEGQSGSPLFVKEDGSRYVVGVLAASVSSQYSGDPIGFHAVRITARKFAMIHAWLRESRLF